MKITKDLIPVAAGMFKRKYPPNTGPNWSMILKLSIKSGD
jgi:hypothetical protein